MQDLGKDANNYKMGQCGPGASTTGNIYGVYDMSGGSYEYVMGAYGPEYPTISSSGFNPDPNVFTSNTIESKYYDVYKTNNEATVCDNNGVCYGHGISEIKGSTTNKGWYGDSTYMVTSSSLWFVRGGNCVNNTGAGVFYRYDYSGDSIISSSARFVGFGK